MAEVYFDESGTHRGSSIMCVAGYIFEKDQAIEFDREWRAVLNTYHLSFFRMSACARGAEPFHNLSSDDCATVEKEMIAITNKWMSCGVAVTVQPDIFMRRMSMENVEGESPYGFCARFCLDGARRWINQKCLAGECAYFFETGHRNHAEANEIMTRTYNDARMRKALRYSSHTFVGKNHATPLQAADLLAWHWYTDMKRRMRGDGAISPTTNALLKGARRNDYGLLHCNAQMIHGLAERRRQRHFQRERGEATAS